ncbi:hypothetical protein CPB83DRAFT_782649 [Crepidotus variabilis]|uniref:ABC1 atypical kinase-like domain-containing protein n=1 Tax=Crepidotus variabilis TaxID=179855 RepID=A0A9P6JU96_9AGAR|nr:hypothetical protein CPB83DRAFT_782649 [Crepidotus variabilis]
MPPSPVYNWACVLHSTAEILGHAARHRAAQLGALRPTAPTGLNTRTVPTESPTPSAPNGLNAPNSELGLSKGVNLNMTDSALTSVSVSASASAARVRNVGPAAQLKFEHMPKPTSKESRDSTVNDGIVNVVVQPTPLEVTELHSSTQNEQLDRAESEEALILSTGVSSEPSNPPLALRTAFIPFEPSVSVSSEPPISAPLTEPPPPPAPPQTPSPPPPPAPSPIQTQTQIRTRTLQSSKVPSSKIGRLFHYGGLAASLSYGAAAELIRRTGSGLGSGSESGSSSSSNRENANANGNENSTNSENSVMLSEANIKRLVTKLIKMRGAALKIGQFLSIQDTHVLPPAIDSIFRQVQDAAHYMPHSQLEAVLAASSSEGLPSESSSPFTQFTAIPFASASIGQVHSAILSPSALASPPSEKYKKDETASIPDKENNKPVPVPVPIPVAVKVQFPGIKESINTDLSYLTWLLGIGKVLPKGLFLDRTVEVMRRELEDECSYLREAGFVRLFGGGGGGGGRYRVPWVWEGSTDSVLVMEMLEGESVGGEVVRGLEQGERDYIASLIIELCLLELFKFHTMQTDPNFSNFLWNVSTRQLGLVDFGATRVYGREFMRMWRGLLEGAVEGDEERCREMSREVGYLVGGESETMINAHIKSLSLLATPFKRTTPQPFSFSPNSESEWGSITAEIRSLIPVMLQERLTPPPRETYSLNRKLSGAFLLASRLGAKVDTRAIWEKVLGDVDRTGVGEGGDSKS